MDDVVFIAQTVEAVQARQRIDPRRVFATGISNGAMMSYRLACETKVFAAIAPDAGAQMVSCDNPAPTSVLHIHGLADTHVPLDGSPGNGLGKGPSTPPSTRCSPGRKVDGCDQPTRRRRARQHLTATCPDGRAVTFITIDGAGHSGGGQPPTQGPRQVPPHGSALHRDQRDRRGVELLRRPPGAGLTEGRGRGDGLYSAVSPAGAGPPRFGQRLDRGGEEAPALELVVRRSAA